ncbi:hypothetical protein [Tunturiibacter gelidiferens]|uniref:hypothetical protein n=1 Tax=Tunturiibacter gelidiferens TaxID=3069689 RepID=UPI003D9B512A
MTKIVLALFSLSGFSLVAIAQDVMCKPAIAPTTTVETNLTVQSDIGQQSEPLRIDTANLNDAQRQAYEAIQAGPPTEYIVKDTMPFDGMVLAARVITFLPGSSLIIGGRFSDRAEKYIVARTIKVIPGAPAPRIVWPIGDVKTQPTTSSNEGLSLSAGFQYLKAPPGAMGSIEGAAGHAGPDGQTGSPGIPGRSAPTLFIFATEVVGGVLEISLRGENGSSGQPGQTGGDGGFGRTGRTSVSSLAGLSGCRADATNGGNGGAGGNGGRGGPGGRGGNGGNFVFVTSAQNATTPYAKQVFQTNLSGGSGGPGAAGGKCGVGGQGGAAQNGDGFCKGGLAGDVGPNGHLGADGTEGAAGIPGQYAIAPLSDDQMKKLGLSTLK